MTDIWQDSLQELRLQMTTATFNTWLADSRLVHADDADLVISVRNAYAADWLQHRLIDVVERIVTAVAGRKYNITFQVAGAPGGDPAETLALESEAAAIFPIFPGFEPIRANFTQMPRQFFEIVQRSEVPVVSSFVASVVDQTYGVIVNYHTSERREWWEASYPEIGRVTGIKSKASVIKAVKISRKNGYVIRQKGTVNYRYRLRRIGEPVDWIKK